MDLLILRRRAYPERIIMGVQINHFTFGILLAGAAVSAVADTRFSLGFIHRDTVGFHFLFSQSRFFVQVGTRGLEQGFVRECANSDGCGYRARPSSGGSSLLLLADSPVSDRVV